MFHFQYNKFVQDFHLAQQSYYLTFSFTITLPDTVDGVVLLVMFSVTTVTPGDLRHCGTSSEAPQIFADQVLME